VNSFAREDGQWDIEAELIDTKSYDFTLRNGEHHPAGAPVHHMQLRVTIDAELTITDAVAVYDAAPYGEYCSAIAPQYRDLIGLNLLRQFRKRVQERFARTAGCTHVTELTNVLPTVAIQTMATLRRAAPPTQRPFQLDGCHALRVDGEVARVYYPKWYEAPRVSDRD
jgi:hypothetical protein